MKKNMYYRVHKIVRKGAFVIFVIFASFLAAQKKGSIQIIADPRVDELLQKHLEFNKRTKTLSGYRVLIASLSGNNSKSSAFRIRDLFASQYPEVSAYIVFEEPNFKVKVGDFKTRLEVTAFYQLIKNQYPCTIIQDQVYFMKSGNQAFIEENELEEK